MKNYVVRYGVVGGVLSIILGLSNWFFIAPNFNPGASQAVGYLSIIVSLLSIPLGIKYYREKLNQGVVSLGQAFRIGLGITSINSIIIFFYGTLFYVIEGDDFDKWRFKGMSANEIEQIQAQMAQMPAYVGTPVFQGVVLALSVFLIGMIINLISSLAMKRLT